MWKPLLNKVFKMRDKVAMNLGKGDEEKPFLEHLDDLRTMLVRIAITLLVFAIGTFVFYQELFSALLYPLQLAGLATTEDGARKLLQNTDVAGPFMMAVNVSLIASVILSFPLLLIFILQFVLPGLRPKEKRLLFPAIGIGTGLFLAGCAFAFWQVLPRALRFFSDFAATMGSRQDWTIDNYVTFSTRFILVFGIAFELPVVVMALVKLDFLNYKLMKSTWRHALIAITLFAAVITPTPDILTLLLMSGPLYILYFICVVLAYFLEKKERKLYPEYYAEREKDEAALEKELPADEWDKEDYNPWDTSGSDEDDEDYKRSKDAATSTETSPAGEVAGEPAAEVERRGEPPGAEDVPVMPVASEEPDDSARKNLD